MATVDDHITMIRAVAKAIGPEIWQDVAFVGGCTTALLLTDLYTRQQVRHTDDVDQPGGMTRLKSPSATVCDAYGQREARREFIELVHAEKRGDQITLAGG